MADHQPRSAAGRLYAAFGFERCAEFAVRESALTMKRQEVDSELNTATKSREVSSAVARSDFDSLRPSALRISL